MLFSLAWVYWTPWSNIYESCRKPVRCKYSKYKWDLVSTQQGFNFTGCPGFSPNVKRGDNVTWTNYDVMPHTVIAGTGPE